MFNNKREHLRLRIELERVRTPLYLATVSGFVGALVVVVALIMPTSDTRFSQLITFATGVIGTGIGGAAGIAQGQKESSANIESVETIEEIK